MAGIGNVMPGQRMIGIKRTFDHSQSSGDGPAGGALPVIVKLLIPIERTGPVIGKGGDVIRSIRSETNAKVKVEDIVPGQTERAITISAADKSGAPSCPTQDALQKLLQRVVEIEGPGGVVAIAPTITTAIIVDRAFVAYIVGKGGESIKHIAKESEAAVTTLKTNKSAALVAPVEECISVTGTFGAVKKALHLLTEKIRDCLGRGVMPLALQQQQQGRGPLQGHAPIAPGIGGPGIGSGQGMGPRPPMGMMSAVAPGAMGPGMGAPQGFPVQAEYRVLIPDHRVGGLIGKNGEHLARIRNATHAEVHVSAKEGDGSAGRLVTCQSVEPVHSNTCGAAEALIRVVQHTLHEKPPVTSPDAHPLEAVAAAAAAAASANADKSVRLVCLARQLGAVIGVKGAMIKQLANDTRARLSVDKEPLPTGVGLPGDEVLKIEGSQQAVLAAVRAVTGLLRNIMAKNQADNKSVPNFQGAVGQPGQQPMVPGFNPYAGQVPGPVPPPYPPMGGSQPMVRQALRPPGAQPPPGGPYPGYPAPGGWLQPGAPAAAPPPPSGPPPGPQPPRAPFSGGFVPGPAPPPVQPGAAPYAYPPMAYAPQPGAPPPQQGFPPMAGAPPAGTAPSGPVPASTPYGAYAAASAPAPAASQLAPPAYPGAAPQAYSAVPPAAAASAGASAASSVAPPAAGQTQAQQAQAYQAYQQQAYAYQQAQQAQAQQAQAQQAQAQQAQAQPSAQSLSAPAPSAYPGQPQQQAQDPAAAAYYYAVSLVQGSAPQAPPAAQYGTATGYGAPAPAPASAAAQSYAAAPTAPAQAYDYAAWAQYAAAQQAAAGQSQPAPTQAPTAPQGQASGQQAGAAAAAPYNASYAAAYPGYTPAQYSPSRV